MQEMKGCERSRFLLTISDGGGAAGDKNRKCSADKATFFNEASVWITKAQKGHALLGLQQLKLITTLQSSKDTALCIENAHSLQDLL